MGTRLAYEGIRQAIIEGRYKPGQRLIEQRIGEELHLSRTPVRESLRLLEAEGLVHSEPQRGVVVRTLTVKDVNDLYQLRSRLEALAAERAASRATVDEVEQLDSAITTFEASIEPAAEHEIEGLRTLNEANNLFHRVIIEAADHVQLTLILARTVDTSLVFQAFRQFSRAETERSNSFHRLIRDAIARKEPDRAARLMAEHVLLGRDALMAGLEDSGTGEEV